MRYPVDINGLDDLYNHIERSETYKKTEDGKIEYTKKFSGYYPLGSGNLWHSGVHIEYKNGEIIYPIIPEGKVIAYRLEEAYKSCELPEKITINQANNEYSNYLDKYEEKSEDGFTFYSLKDGTQDKTYTVSNNFILLKHEIDIEQLERPLVFYSLYMNLAPVNSSGNPNQVFHTKDNPFYPDFMCVDSNSKDLKRGFQQVSTPEKIQQIGKAGYLRGKRYIDFCIFTEKSLFDYFKEKNKVEKQNLLFHHINSRVSFYKRSEKTKSKKIYWPTGTECVIDEKVTNENGTAIKFHVTRIRPYFEEGKENVDYQISGKKIKVLKTDTLQLTDKKISSNGLSFKDTVFVLTTSLTGDREFEKTGNSVVAFFVPEDGFKPVSYWTEGTDVTPDTEKYVTVYDSNPLIYEYSSVGKSYNSVDNLNKIKGFDLDNEIEARKIKEKLCKVIGLKSSENEDLFIKKPEALKYYESAFDWEKWFYNIPDNNNDIVCDRTGSIQYWIQEYNKGIDYSKISDKYLEEWWKGTFITDIYLRTALCGDGTGYEFAKEVRKMFRKATCYHPLEWDSTLFSNNKISDLYKKNTGTLLAENVKQVLINESSKADIWKDALNKMFKTNCFYFVHPIYFSRHLEKAKVLISCLCDEDLTWENLTAVGITESRAKQYIDSLNETFNKFNLNSCLRKAHFLAQVMHESVNLQYTAEINGTSADYAPYYGRGLMQLTFESNYRAYGNYIKEDVYTFNEQSKNPDYSNLKKLESAPHAMLSAGWFWDVNKSLNSLADKNDLIEITRNINGGFNGYNDRLKHLKDIKEKIIKECSKDSFSLDYKLEDSKGYNVALTCFAWGVWHDEAAGKKGCTYDKNEAIKGYRRCVEIGSTKANNYGIKKLTKLYGSPDKNGNLLITDAASHRLKQLEEKK